MLFLFRFAYTAIILILGALIFPPFKPGGRYQILFVAATGALLFQLIENIFENRVAYRERGLINGGGILVGFLLGWLLFKRVYFTFTGIIFSYLGVSFMEMLLPIWTGKTVFVRKGKE